MVVDFSAFHSRFQVKGRLVFQTAMRIGAGGSGGATEQDLPVLKDLIGRPYIPGSSFKGVYRAHLERLLRGVKPDLACVSVPRAKERNAAAGCLTQEDVDDLKRTFINDPETLSQEILEKSCWTCRLCGAPWLASKLMVRDMPVVEETWFERYLIRDGVAIDRDTETAAGQMKYDYEAVPAQTAFGFEMIIDNATDAELGLALLGLREFEAGLVTLGGGRSRGLGQAKLELDWPGAALVKKDGLRAYLLERATISLAEEKVRKEYWQTFVGEIYGEGGQADAQATG
jgi:CRISPR-associated RAMP protein (TIGR02581 family)